MYLICNHVFIIIIIGVIMLIKLINYYFVSVFRVIHSKIEFYECRDMQS